MLGWPDAETAEEFFGSVPEADVQFVEDCLDAAVEYLTERLCLETTTNTSGDEIPIVPAPVAQAALLLASRLYRRRNAPNELAVETLVVQPSLLEGIETLISPWRAWGIA